MKNPQLEVEIRELKLRHAWGISRGVATSKENVFVSIEHEGIVGMGEAGPNSRYDESAESTVDFLDKARTLLNKYPLWHFEDLGWAILEQAPGQTAAKAALDIALMDWFCKKHDLPLYRFLGLNPALTPLTSFSIGIDTPERMQQKVHEAAPYPILKIKLGSDNDEAIIRAIRAVTDKTIRVDANEGWTDRQEALEKVEWLATEKVEFIEQPMPAAMVDETAWLRERSPLPLIADESVKGSKDIHQLKGVFDGINIKLMKSGGIQEALRMIRIARSLDLSIMLGCMVESSLAISAAAALSPLVDYADLDGNLLLAEDPYRGVTVAEGKLMLTDVAGVGAVFNEIDG